MGLVLGTAIVVAVSGAAFVVPAFISARRRLPSVSFVIAFATFHILVSSIFNYFCPNMSFSYCCVIVSYKYGHTECFNFAFVATKYRTGGQLF